MTNSDNQFSPMSWVVSCALALAILLAPVVAPSSAQAQTYTVLHTFTGGPDGGKSYAGLVRDGGGSLYGTTQVGGTTASCFYGPGCGTVFKLTSSGQLKVLYAFTGKDDGGNPTTGLVRDSSGNLYGTADWAGQYTAGVLYKVPKAGGSQTVIHAFKGKPTDGAAHLSALIRDSAGNLYGTTASGGTANSGTVYKIDPLDNETLLYSFKGGTADGAFPWGGVIRDGAGNLYGTTQQCGTAGLGTVFKLTASGTERILYNFPGGKGGQIPDAGVIRDSAGNVFGTTYNGGPFNSNGTAYKLTSAGAEKFQFSFNQSDGGEPYAGLIRDKAGNLYGTTTIGGANSSGTVFKIDTSGNETVLYNFTGGADGASPFGGLILDSAGNLYGTTSGGGNRACELGCGVVYKLTP